MQRIQKTTDRPILLAAAGTGGHLYPALAVYRLLKARGLTARLLTDERGLRYADGFEENDINIVPSGGLVSGSPIKRINGLWKLFRGWRESRQLLIKYDACGVIGFGGYGSVPPIIAADQLGVKSILYQGDAILGRANAFVSACVNKLCLSFPNTARIPTKANDKITVVGAPMRAEIEALHSLEYKPFAHSKINLLIIGGSLGAKAFSQLLPCVFDNLGAEKRQKFRIVQQVTDTQDLRTLEKRYTEMALDHELLPFVHDMDQRLAQADLIIARSGGTTVHECAAVGRASIFIPLGLHADGQQSHNARYLQESNAAWIVSENDAAPSGIAEILRNVLDKPEQLAHKAKNAKSKAILGATENIVSLAISEFNLT